MEVQAAGPSFTTKGLTHVAELGAELSMCRLCAHPDLWAEFAASGASQKASVREERAQVVYLTVTLETSPVLLCCPPPVSSGAA